MEVHTDLTQVQVTSLLPILPSSGAAQQVQYLPGEEAINNIVENVEYKLI